MTSITHRFVHTNGIRMHVAEAGEGPLVVLCHGFPESWYSWRHQIRALAAAGYRVVAPDQRGYGQTDVPSAVEAYGMFDLVGDLVGLVHALGEEHAVIVGHDWGAPVAWHSALLRPDMFHTLALLSIPYSPREWTDIRPSEAQKLAGGDRQFYQRYFLQLGVAERDLEADVRRTLRCFLYSGSGDPPPAQRWRFFFDKTQTFLDTCHDPAVLPAWLNEEDIDHFTAQFERTGFGGALNWYRNIDARWEQTPFLSGARPVQPTLFIAGEHEAMLEIRRAAFDQLEQHIPRLRKKVILPGAGHWLQQERPDEVNRLLLEFLQEEAPPKRV